MSQMSQMSQMRFGDAEYWGKRKQTRREKFLAVMEQVVPWDALLRRFDRGNVISR